MTIESEIQRQKKIIEAATEGRAPKAAARLTYLIRYETREI